MDEYIKINIESIFQQIIINLNYKLNISNIINIKIYKNNFILFNVFHKFYL